MVVKRMEPFDPAVDVALEDTRSDDVYSRLARARKMTPAQRKKAERDRKRSRVTFDWPADLVKRMEGLAAQHGVPVSQLAGLLALYALNDVDAGRIDIGAHKRPTTTPRYEWLLDFEMGHVSRGWAKK